MCNLIRVAVGIAAMTLVSGCMSTDPISLLPPVERGYLKTLVRENPEASKRPISVTEMLNRVRGKTDEASGLKGLEGAPPVAELRFHPKERILSDRHVSGVDKFRDAVKDCDECNIVIELPTYKSDPMLHYQRALSVAGRLGRRADRVRIKIRRKMTPHILRIKVASRAS